MKRPFGITISAFFLAWLAISGFGNAAIIFTGQFPEMPTIVGVVALLYGITALFSTIGLWGMKQWSIVAVRSWMGVCFLFLIVFTTLFHNLMLGGFLGAFGFFLFTLLLFWLFDRYVKSKLKPAT